MKSSRVAWAIAAILGTSLVFDLVTRAGDHSEALEKEAQLEDALDRIADMEVELVERDTTVRILRDSLQAEQALSRSRAARDAREAREEEERAREARDRRLAVAQRVRAIAPPELLPLLDTLELEHEAEVEAKDRQLAAKDRIIGERDHELLLVRQELREVDELYQFSLQMNAELADALVRSEELREYWKREATPGLAIRLLEDVPDVLASAAGAWLGSQLDTATGAPIGAVVGSIAEEVISGD